MLGTPRYEAEPIRLFKSDFLEFFSHVKPVTVLALWCPVTLFFLYDSFARARGTADVAYVGLGVITGWFVWTLVEYLLHRFFFHFHPKTERFRRLFFLAHGVHHAQPLCRTRLVMPPVISIPIGVTFFGIFHFVLDSVIGRPQWFSPVFAGFIVGYIVYDMMHYNLHHSRVKNPYVLMCRRQHMQHHGTCPTMRFGVSSPVWDYVFGTMPKAPAPKPAAQKSPAAPLPALTRPASSQPGPTAADTKAPSEDGVKR